MRIPNTTRRRRGATVRRRSSDRGSIFEIDLTHERAWEDYMPDSVYKVIELVGTSTKSWEDAAKNAVDRAAKSLRDLRVAEVVTLDMVLDHGKVEAYRAKINVSFKYEGGG
jgi:flavin-binding protein dodecin